MKLFIPEQSNRLRRLCGRVDALRERGTGVRPHEANVKGESELYQFGLGVSDLRCSNGQLYPTGGSHAADAPVGGGM